MTEPAGAGAPEPRAFLRLGGAPLARHQLGLALAMDCQRVICIARAATAELFALQHDAEQAGARFHIVTGPRALAGLVTANDDLLALTDGLLADPQVARALLEPGHAVLVQPVETGVAAGFERIDLNHASAGALRIPGRLVERLQELPPDCDAVSALTRIALQAGIAMQEVPAAARQGARWRLIADESEAHAVETEWMRLHMGERVAPTPSALLSRLAMRNIGPSLLHAGSGARVVLLAAIAVLLIGLGAGWLRFTVTGLLFLAVAAVLRESLTTLQSIERSALGLAPPPVSAAVILGWTLDLAMIALIAWSAPLMPWESLADRLFAPVMLVLLVHLLPAVVDRTLSTWFADRVLLAALLALAATVGYLASGVQLLAVALAFGGMLLAGGKPRLT